MISWRFISLRRLEVMITIAVSLPCKILKASRALYTVVEDEDRVYSPLLSRLEWDSEGFLSVIFPGLLENGRGSIDTHVFSGCSGFDCE
jgi:hypothetical protein